MGCLPLKIWIVPYETSQQVSLQVIRLLAVNSSISLAGSEEQIIFFQQSPKMLKIVSENFIQALLLFLGLFLKISRWVPLNTLHMPCFSPSWDRSCVKMADRFASRGYSLKKQLRWSNDKTVVELGYRKISWFVCGERLGQIIDLLATDKSRCFAQPRPIIVNYFSNLDARKSLESEVINAVV